MDSFKIVRTIVNGTELFSAVPHKWEKDNILWWPDHYKCEQLEAARADASSTPRANWGTYRCILKCSHVKTLREVKYLEKQYTNISDVSAEQFTSDFQETSNKIKKDPDYSPSEEVEDVEDDDDEYFPSASTSPHVDGMTCEIDNIIPPDSPAPMDDQLVTVNEQDLSSIKNDISEIKTDIGKMNTKLDSIYKLLKQLYNDRNGPNIMEIEPPPHRNIQKLQLPLSTHDQIVQLENDLMDTEYFSQLVAKFSLIFGTQGDQNGIKIGYKLVDKLFSSQILTTYTWTGVSRIKDSDNISKRPFCYFNNVHTLIYKIILLADRRHTIKRNEYLFKECVLKHSKKRNMRKRKST